MLFYAEEILKFKLTGNLSSELLFHLWTNFKQFIVSLCLPWESKNFGLSGIFINNNAKVILGSEHVITNRFHDLNKIYSFSILNVCGIINHATPEIKNKYKLIPKIVCILILNYND